MEEFNKDQLRKALQQLPEYRPPAACWEQLSNQLEQPSPLPLDQLRGYAPPAAVWNQLNDSLDRNQLNQGRIRRLRWMAVAASVLLLVGAWGWYQASQGPTVRIVYRQEPASQITLNSDWDQENEQFEALFSANHWETDRGPAFADLQLEIEELTEAKEEVKAMLVAYGEDPNLIRQLGKIERERSDVYRQIITNDLAE